MYMSTTLEYVMAYCTQKYLITTFFPFLCPKSTKLSIQFVTLYAISSISTALCNFFQYIYLGCVKYTMKICIEKKNRKKLCEIENFAVFYIDKYIFLRFSVGLLKVLCHTHKNISTKDSLDLETLFLFFGVRIFFFLLNYFKYLCVIQFLIMKKSRVFLTGML